MALLGFSSILFFAAVFLVNFYNFYYKRRKFPRGPTPLPLIGNLLSVTRDPPGEDCYIRWYREFGPIYTFWSGEQPVVVVAEYKKIMETFQKDGDAYAGRFGFGELDKTIKGGSYGVVFTEGDLWRDQRRFTLTVFRNFGLGTNVMEEKVISELETRFDQLNQQIKSGTEVHNIGDLIEISIGSIINNLLFGYKFYGDTANEFFELKKLIARFEVGISSVPFLMMSPNPSIYRHLPIFKECLADVMHNYGSLQEFFRRQINEHIKDIDFENVDEPSTDYVEAYLREKAKRDSKSETDHYYAVNQLSHLCFDVWSAGQETTSTTITWAVAHILHNLDVQRKMQDELDTVIGTTDRFITMADRSRLPYTCAVVNEALRIANLLPFNLLHRTTKDVEIDGHFIPKGTCIVPQISAVLYDEKVFPEPKKFNPDRYITEEGKLKRSDELIPFSAGKRQCLGESLARMELFLYIANFFNHYNISPSSSLPSLKRHLSVVVQCPEFYCNIEQRECHKRAIPPMSQ